MNFKGFSIDKLQTFKSAKIEIHSFRKHKSKKQYDIPEWLLAFDKIHEKDQIINERCKINSR